MASAVVKNLSGKVALITGAGSGIGAATAVLFSKLGASLSLTDRANMDTVAQKCENLPFQVTGDIRKEDDTKQILEKTLEKYGKIDILINNAGILERGSIENTNMEQYDRMFDTNVRPVYHLTMLAVPYLIATKGCIVNTSSVNGIRAFPGVLAYNMSKAAIDQFTRCVALELASKQVRVNCVSPGVIVTNLQKRGMDEEGYAKFLEESKHRHALGRPGTAEEVAQCIAFLASDQSSFITGTSLSVDGGRHSMCTT